MRGEERGAVYEAAQRFVERALRADDSLFTPGRAVWSPPAIADLYERFVENQDPSADTFEHEFSRQLDGAPVETAQLAAELLDVQFLAP